MGSETSATEPASKRPRWSLIVRVFIYIPLLGFFGWRAWDKAVDGRASADERFKQGVSQALEADPGTRTIKLPDGREIPVLELSESEAIERGLIPAPTAEAPPTADAPPASPTPADAPPPR